MAASAEIRLVVFDGLCNVCSGGARFLQRHEIKPLSSTFDSAGASENPQAGEGSQRERARGPPGADRP